MGGFVLHHQLVSWHQTLRTRFSLKGREIVMDNGWNDVILCIRECVPLNCSNWRVSYRTATVIAALVLKYQGYLKEESGKIVSEFVQAIIILSPIALSTLLFFLTSSFHLPYSSIYLQFQFLHNINTDTWPPQCLIRSSLLPYSTYLQFWNTR